MNRRIQLLELTDAIIASSGLTKRKGEALLRTMFDIIEEGLLRDHIVKVKGLGTFKLIVVSPRESVSVNTGQRIQIDSYTKVTFTPEKKIAELVNRPFRDFDTVPLNPDTPLAELEAVGKETATPPPVPKAHTPEIPVLSATTPTKQESPTSVPPLTPTSISASSLTAPRIPESNPEPIEDLANNESIEVSTPSEPTPSTAEVETPTPPPVPVNQQKATEYSVGSDSGTTATPPLPITTSQNIDSPTPPVPPNEEPKPEPTPDEKTWGKKLMLAIVCFAAVALLALIYYIPAQKDTTNKETKIEATNDQKDKTEKNQVATPPTTPPQQKVEAPYAASPAADRFFIVLATGVPQDLAENFVSKLRAQGFPDGRVIQWKEYLRVIYGDFPDHNSADQTLQRLRNEAGIKEAWIEQVKNDSNSK